MLGKNGQSCHKDHHPHIHKHSLLVALYSLMVRLKSWDAAELEPQPYEQVFMILEDTLHTAGGKR